MTDIVVGLTLRADGKGFVGEVRNAKTELLGLRDGGTRAAGALDDLGRRSTTALTSLRSLQTVIAGLGLAIGVREAVQEFAAYERALVGVAKTADLTAGQVSEMGAAITEMARRMPFARTELLGIAQAGGQLGVKGVKDLTLFTETIAKLGSASDLAGDEAATALTRILNVTNESIGSIDKFASVIVALGNASAASESEIAKVATQVAQATAIFGVSAAEAAAMAAALRSLGVQAELGGSSVGKAFRAIEAAVDGGGERLRELEKITGLTGAQLKKTFKDDAVAVFKAFVDGVGQAAASGASVAGVLEKFGLEGEEILKVLPTLALNSEKLGDSLAIIAKEAGNATALNEEYLRSAKTLSAQLSLTGNAIDEIAAALGSALAPVIVDATTQLRAFVQEAVDSGDAQAAFEAVAGAVGLLTRNLDLLAGAGAVGVFLRLQPAIAGILGSLNALVPAVAASTVGWLSLNSAVAAGTAVDLSSARATELKAAAQVETAAAALAAARADEIATAAALANVKAKHAQAVAALEAAVQAQAAGKVQQATGRQLAALRLEEATAARIVADAEARLAAAQTAVAATSKAAAGASVTHAAAMQAASMSARAATAATLALSGAMNLLGGPAGVALLAAGGLYYLATRETEADRAARSHAEAIDLVNRALGRNSTAGADAAEVARKSALARLQDARAALKQAEAVNSGAFVGPEDQLPTTQRNQMKALRLQIEELETAIKDLDVDAALEDLLAVNTALFGNGSVFGPPPSSNSALGALSTELRDLVEQLDPLAKLTREAANAQAQLEASSKALAAEGHDLARLLGILEHNTDAYTYSLGAAARTANEQARDLQVQSQIRRLEANDTEESRRTIVELTAARELERVELQRVQATMAAQPDQIGAINAAYATLRAAIIANRDAELQWSTSQAQAFKGLRDQLDPTTAKQDEFTKQQRLLNAALAAGRSDLGEHAKLTAALRREQDLWKRSLDEAARSVRTSAEDLELANEVRRLELLNTEEAREKIIELTTARKLEQLEIERTTALLAAQPEQYAAINAAYDRLKLAIMDEGQIRQLERLRAQANPLAQAFKTAAEGIQRGFSDAFTAMFRSGQFGFKDMLGSWKDAFARMLGELATLAIARPIIVPLVSSIGQSLGLTDAAIQSVTGNLGGAAGGQSGGGFNFSSLTNLIPGNGLDFSSITGGINSYLFGTAGGSASSAGVSAVAGGLSNAPSAGLFGTYGASSLGGVLGGAGLGFGAGSLLNGLVGGNETGGTIGSAGGALAGAIIGSIVPGIGTIIGGLIGGAGGGLLGGMFGGSGPSVGPTTIGRVTDLTDPSSAVYTFDNGGDSEDAVTKIIDAIVEGIEAGTERYAGALRPGSGLDIAYFSGPDAESSQGAGINLKPIIDSVLADTDRFKGLSPDEAVQQATFIALSEMVDYQSATLDELVRNTKATDLEGLLSDLDYGRNLDDLTEALRANGDAINANSLAIAQNIVDRKRRAEETAKNRAAPIADSIERALELFPALTGSADDGASLAAAIAEAMRGTVLESDRGAVRGGTPDFRFVSGGERDDPSYIAAGDQRYEVSRVASDNRSGTAFALSDEAGDRIAEFDSMAQLLAGAGSAVADYNERIADQAVALGLTAEEQERHNANMLRVRDVVAISRASVDELIATITGSFEPAITGPFTENVAEATAVLEALAPHLEDVNDQIEAANEAFPGLGAEIYDVTATIAEAVQVLRAQAAEDLLDIIQALENDANGRGAINGIGGLTDARDKLLADAQNLGVDAGDRILDTFGDQLRRQLSGLDALGLAAAFEQTTDEAARAVITSMLDEMFAVQQEAAVAEKRNGLLEAYQREAQVLGDLASRMRAFSLSIGGFLDQLKRGELAPGGPVTRLAAAKEQFDEVFRRAQLGDEQAITDLNGAAQAFLEASQAVNGDRAAYNDDFDLTVERLEQVKAVADRQARVAESQLSELRAQVGQYVELNDNVISVEQAIRDLQAVAGSGLAALLQSGQSPSDTAAANGFNFGAATDTNMDIYDRLVQLGLPTPEAFGGGQLNALRQRNAAVDAALRSMGYEQGGWHPGGLARIHNDELLYTGPPAHVFNAKESLALLEGQRNAPNVVDFEPVVRAQRATTAAVVDAGNGQMDATAELAGEVATLRAVVDNQAREIRELTQFLKRRA